MSGTGRLALLLAVGLARGVGASATQAEKEAPAYTFHVSSDLLQIPVLVLSPEHRQLPAIDPSRFSVSIAGGKPFRPQVSREGDEPIALSVLVDSSATAGIPGRQFAAMASSLSGALHPNDTVAVDRLDQCLIRPLLPSAPVEAAAVTGALARAAVAPSRAETAEAQGRCQKKTDLWNALTVVIATLSRQRGWRVILVLTEGSAAGGDADRERMEQSAVSSGVTVFAMIPSQGHETSEHEWMSRGMRTALASGCGATGGMVLDRDPANDGTTLAHFVGLLRNRYILEFPRPEHLPELRTRMAVRIAGVDAYLRQSGVSFKEPGEVGGEAPSQSVKR